MKEVCLFIRWTDGTETFRRFDTCEECWLYERDTVKKEKNRREKEKRKFVAVSLYYGCTSPGNVYGGLLSGYDSRQELETVKAAEFYRKFPGGRSVIPLS